MLINPSLSIPPDSGFLIDIVNYEEADAQEGLYKNLHCFFDPQLTVVTGVDGFEFTVSAPDAAKLFVGSPVRIHNDDYSIDTGEPVIKVKEISGVNIIVDTDLGFTPGAGQKVDLIGFAIDKGKPYVLL